jgi:hypothetical protein
MAKGVKSDSPESGSRQGGVKGDPQEPVSADRLSVGGGKGQFLFGVRTLEFPPLEIGNEKSGN